MIRRNWDLILVIAVLCATVGYMFAANRKIQRTDSIISAMHAQTDSLMQDIAYRDTQYAQITQNIIAYKDTVRDLRAKNQRSAVQYAKIIKRKDQIIKDAQVIPPDMLYSSLQKIYEDTSDNKPYKFSLSQVRSIYITAVESDYKDNQIANLEDRIRTSEAIISYQDNIIKSDSAQIQILTTISSDLRQTVSNKNQEIIIWRKMAHNKRMWMGTAIISSVVAVISIF